MTNYAETTLIQSVYSQWVVFQRNSEETYTVILAISGEYKGSSISGITPERKRIAALYTLGLKLTFASSGNESPLKERLVVENNGEESQSLYLSNRYKGLSQWESQVQSAEPLNTLNSSHGELEHIPEAFYKSIHPSIAALHSFG